MRGSLGNWDECSPSNGDGWQLLSGRAEHNVGRSSSFSREDKTLALSCFFLSFQKGFFFFLAHWSLLGCVGFQLQCTGLAALQHVGS